MLTENLERPYPPEEMVVENWIPQFEPSPELAHWVHRQYLTEGGLLHNPDHSHLQRARIGFLWTNVPNKRQMHAVAGTAEMPMSQGGVWAKARAKYHLHQWFRQDLQFLITLDSSYAAEADDMHFAALVDHELYHCGHAVDYFGCRRYTKDGEPVYAIRGHDAEEFVGVVRRFGVGAAAGGVAQLVAAANAAPTIAVINVARACGTCQR